MKFVALIKRWPCAMAPLDACTPLKTPFTTLNDYYKFTTSNINQSKSKLGENKIEKILVSN